MPSSSQTPVGTSPVSILLVEEYKALAIAFGSALKQFAPGFATHVVGSLAQADAILDELKPALLVVDCDPPPLRSVQFFDRLRSRLPNVRVLIVAAENAEGLAERDAIRPALEFIKKPFELQKFGAVVERLLSPASPEFVAARNLRLLDMILLYAVTAAPIVLRVKPQGGRSGEIHFADGRIVHAAVPGRAGAAAMEAMLNWRAPRFSEGERTLKSPRTIHGAWIPVLRHAIQAMVDDALVAAESAPPPPELEAPPSLPATKLVVVDDTDLLLDFVEEMLASAHPEFEIVTAVSGFDGLKRAAADKPDLVLLDYDLPDITGADVCEKLLENEETARIPVIMMSGHVSEMRAVSERFENVVATIEKPFLSATLIDLVEQILRDLPKLRVPFAKKIKISPPPLEIISTPQKAPPPSINGARISHKSVPSFVAGLAEEYIPASFLDPSSSTEIEIEEAVEASRARASAPKSLPEVHSSLSAEVPAGIPRARSNAVVLGLPLEVLAIDLSPRLRVMEIRARPVSSSVSLHTLPQSSARPPQAEKPFRLAQVQLNREGELDFVRVAPAPEAKDHPSTRYQLAIDGVKLVPADDSNTVQLTTSAAPIRLELLGLFELARVELSTDFSVDHLVLKRRDKRMRATLLPEAIHIGATFTITKLSLTSTGTIGEIRLVAFQSSSSARKVEST